MQVVRDAFSSADLPYGCVVTIGNYDGVHVGQQEVIKEVVARARETRNYSVVVTFDPHPLSVVAPEMSPLQITTLQQKEALLAALGIDFMLVISFSQSFSTVSAQAFVQDFLRRRLGMEHLYVGDDFHFGRAREGNAELLARMAPQSGYEFHPVKQVRSGGDRVSSSRIRELILRGATSEVIALLGRPFAIAGVIAQGDRMGQRLGWPTINITPDSDLVPAEGVYTTVVSFPRMPAEFDSVTNIGTRPTVYENFARVVESHILDFRSDVYGERVELRFYKRLREERLFPSTVALSAQIGRDVEAARAFFQELRAQGTVESMALDRT